MGITATRDVNISGFTSRKFVLLTDNFIFEKIAHITTLQPPARSLHRSMFTAPDMFKQVQRELSDLIIILDTTEQKLH